MYSTSGSALEDVLRAIAVVRIEIDDRHALELMPTHQMFGRNCHVIEQAETQRLIRFRMMTRWPDGTERSRDIPRHHLVAGCQDAAGRQGSHLVTLGTDVRVGRSDERETAFAHPAHQTST